MHIIFDYYSDTFFILPFFTLDFLPDDLFYSSVLCFLLLSPQFIFLRLPIIWCQQRVLALDY
jgi:hypothetical protein